MATSSSSVRLTAPRGTVDLVPPESTRWQILEACFRDIAARFGYGEIRTPMFESTELFVRGVGEATDIVEKEMYTFLDKGDRSMTLRPEWTAPVVRALLEKKRFGQDAQRLFYIGPFFRYERPQAGRLRQAHQFGVESYGFAGPEADHEVIALAMQAVASQQLKSAVLSINSIGDAACRPAYRDALLAHFRPHAATLSEDSQRRLERNPLRLLDSKATEDQALIASAPAFYDVLCEPCRSHFDGLCNLLDATGIPYHVSSRLVRGFDYYTRTVFEISSDALGAQTAICGGGRYDGLVESLGGPPTPAVGFGMGMERVLLAIAAAEQAVESPRRGIQAIALGLDARAQLIPLISELRRVADLPVFIDFGNRKIVAQYKIGDQNLARIGLICGENELAQGVLIARDLLTREESRLEISASVGETALQVLQWYAQRESTRDE
jgi:histidyl-tRNA synthetase